MEVTKKLYDHCKSVQESVEKDVQESELHRMDDELPEHSNGELDEMFLDEPEIITWKSVYIYILLRYFCADYKL